MKNDCERMMECNPLPDACTNELHEEAILNRQEKNDDRPYIQRVIARDRNLIIACVVLAVLMNFTEGRYILYPFKIFSTWVHEMCHGLAALLTPRGRIGSLRIFEDGGGLAVTSVRSSWASNFVSSAGYPGTAVTGFIMLIFRRTNLGPTIGLIFLGACMLLSVALWVRNSWGMWFLSIEGAVLLLFAWKLPAQFIDNLYNFLAATCCLNAVENVRDLFADYYQVDGEEVQSTDAHATAEGWGGDYRMWATFWLWLSFTLTVAGIFLSIDAGRLPSWAKNSRKEDPSAQYYSGGGGGYGDSSIVTSNYSRFGAPARVV